MRTPEPKPLPPDLADPFDGPYGRPWLDRAFVRFAAAVAVVSLCAAAVVALAPPP